MSGEKRQIGSFWVSDIEISIGEIGTGFASLLLVGAFVGGIGERLLMKKLFVLALGVSLSGAVFSADKGQSSSAATQTDTSYLAYSDQQDDYHMLDQDKEERSEKTAGFLKSKGKLFSETPKMGAIRNSQ